MKISYAITVKDEFIQIQNLINHILRPRAIKPSPTYKLKRRLRSEYNETAHQPRDATEDDVADEV